MAKRKTITAKLRFEVFKRDSFTCQYCGRMAPEVLLEVDHINPVSAGGDNDIMNLTTSCLDCNRGKGKRKLSENDEIKKQQAELKELNEKRNQMKMMLEWREEVRNLNMEQVEAAEDAFEAVTGSSFTDYGKEKMRKHIKKYGLCEVLDTIEIVLDRYYNENDESSVGLAFSYIPRVLANREKAKKDPNLKNKQYIGAVIRNSYSYVNNFKLKEITDAYIHNEEDFREMLRIAKNNRSWTGFIDEVSEVFGGD